MLKKKSHTLLFLIFIALCALGYFAAIDPNKFGFYHDDAVYLVTGKALAIGQGYRILSLPHEPWQTKYPPVFPIALSILWRTNPTFPDNLPWFSAFSVLCTALFLVLTAAYLLKNSYASPVQIMVVAIFAALNWRLIILATSVLSEMLYAALTVGALYLAAYRGERRVAARSLGLGIMLALVALTRLAGISLLAAVLFYAFRRRQTRRFLVPLAMASILVAGWFWWCHLHPTPSMDSQTAYYTDYIQNWQFLIQSDESGNENSLWGSTALMVGKNTVRMLAAIPVVCLGIQINQIQDITEAWRFSAILIGLLTLIFLVIGFRKSRSLGNGLMHYYIIFYIVLHLFWPYTIYDRILIPILPFLLLFVISGSTDLFRGFLQGIPNQNRLAKTVSLLFICTIFASVIASAVFGLVSGFRDQILRARAVYAAEAQGKHELIDWLKIGKQADDILVSYRDPVYFLYTYIPGRVFRF